MTQPQITREPFGTLPGGEAVDLYTLVNERGTQARIINYGGILVSLRIADDTGVLSEVVLGYSDLAGYLANTPYFGALVGRYANRIGDARFVLDNVEYRLAANDGANHLHGGVRGFDKALWRAAASLGAAGPVLELRYVSPDGEEGYPGTLSATVSYTLTNNNELVVEYQATTDKPTLCNLAHHSYFNLGGHNSGDVLGHEVQIFAANNTPADDTLIPTGKIAPVAGTPFDFTKPKAAGKDLKAAGGMPVGFDLNYVLDKGTTDRPQLAARVTEPKSGRVLEVLSTEPGLQFYTGNFLDGTNVGKGGAVYKQYNGFCMEPQKFPDSVNKPEWKDVSNPVLRPGETYKQTTIYRFGVAK